MGLCPYPPHKEKDSFHFPSFTQFYSAKHEVPGRSGDCEEAVTVSVAGEGRAGLEQVLMVHFLRSHCAQSSLFFLLFPPNLKNCKPLSWVLGACFPRPAGYQIMVQITLTVNVCLPCAPSWCPHTLLWGKWHEGCRSVGVFCKPHLKAEELGPTGSTGCQVLPSLAGCISLSGDGSWCQVLTALTYAGNFLVFCHKCDPSHVLLLSPDPCCGEKGQQELALHLQMCLVFTPWVLCHAR